MLKSLIIVLPFLISISTNTMAVDISDIDMLFSEPSQKTQTFKVNPDPKIQQEMSDNLSTIKSNQTNTVKKTAEWLGLVGSKSCDDISGVYITNWGYDFSGDDRVWGRNGIKLSSGSTIYTWLQKENYGSRCYQLFVQGSFHGGASNCSDSINNNWAASCGNDCQFWVQGNQTDVVKAIVQKCGN
jgi:hypothetical protein